MRRGFILSLLCVLLLTTGCFSWWRKSEDSPQKSASPQPGVVEQQETKTEDTSSEKEEKKEEPMTQEEKERKLAPPPPPPNKAPAKPSWTQHKVETATPEEKKFTTDVQEWLKDLRVLLEHIQVALFVAKGMPIETLLGEGAAPPDLHREHGDFVKLSTTLSLPPSCDEAEPIIATIKEDLQNMMESLSDPPTLSELEAAEPKRKDLTTSLNELYGIANNYCQG